MEQKNEGICRFCLKTFAGSTMARHLKSCTVKEEQDAQLLAKSKVKYPIYHIQLTSYRYYWLHIEMKASAMLRELDEFLRHIWLECCGHLSMFTIGGLNYEESYEQNYMDEFLKKESASIDTSLVKILNVGDTFDYKYDFGSTTRVDGKIIAARQGVIDKPIKILARNNPYKVECDGCSKEASDLCPICESYLCEECLSQHECEDEVLIPVVNSPRMGVCGYTGDYDDDDFSLTARK